MTVGEAAQEAWPVCAAEGCVHTLDLTTSKMLDDTSKGSVVDARNYIEGELALFLRRCPRGVVVVQVRTTHQIPKTILRCDGMQGTRR